jgi:DNA-binding winged helix-turn-helix (wHTH) protein/tetratricopeptide (TPR) repeat protein
MRRASESPSENLKPFSNNAPAASVEPDAVYEFGPFRLDPREHLLLRDGEPVVLSAKVFDLLLVLVRNKGRLVTKSQLIKIIWPNTFVEEGNLTQNVSILRKSLGSTEDSTRYVETVPKVGYRFAAPVREFYAQASGRNPAQAPPEWRRGLVLVLALLAITIVVVYSFVANRRPASIDSLAVLPFTVIGDVPNTEYLADGIVESIIRNLTQLPNVKIASFASVTPYKGTDAKDAERVGKQLGVRAVLLTRLTQWNDELVIRTELLDTNDHRRMWEQEYRRKLADIVGLQEEVATDISEKLHHQMSPGEEDRLRRRYTESAEAYRLYLEGRYFWNKRTADGQVKAIEHFQRAVDVDPNYSLAYAGLADAYLLGFMPSPPVEQMPKAREAAVHALRLDETLPEAHAALGLVKARFDWDWAGAETELRRAIELDPSYATAHERYARLLIWRGRKDEAIGEILHAQHLDPVSLIISTNVAEIFYFARDYDRAVIEARKVVEMDPNFPQARWRLAEAYVQKGMFPEAVEQYLNWISLLGASHEHVDALRRAYSASGMRGFWQELIVLFEHPKNEIRVTSRRLASIHARLSQTDHALEQLENAYLERELMLVEVNVEPAFDKIRSEPRFTQLLHDVGFGPE